MFMCVYKCIEEGLERYQTMNSDDLWGEEGCGASEHAGERAACAFISRLLLRCLMVKE